MDIYLGYFVLAIKYAVAIWLLAVIFFAPAWMAAQTKKNKTDTAMIRLGSYTLGWTGIGWLWSLFKAAKK